MIAFVFTISSAILSHQRGSTSQEPALVSQGQRAKTTLATAHDIMNLTEM